MFDGHVVVTVATLLATARIGHNVQLDIEKEWDQASTCLISPAAMHTKPRVGS
jgi:hypothetical protein